MRAALLVALLVATPVPASDTAAPPRIAIIIDDLGHHLATGRRAVALPGPVVCAVLPHTPAGAALAALARQSGKEVLLHLPLQAVDPGNAAEPGGITLDMGRRHLADALADGLASVPYAVGINSHRGSLLTRHPGHMGWLMEEIGRRGLFFIDSYTTHRSVALMIAREAGVPSTRRDVFLDADPAPERIGAEFERLESIARQRGTAVAIGHPYPATLDFLEARLPDLAADGIELVALGELLRTPPAPAAPAGASP